MAWSTVGSTSTGAWSRAAATTSVTVSGREPTTIRGRERRRAVLSGGTSRYTRRSTRQNEPGGSVGGEGGFALGLRRPAAAAVAILEPPGELGTGRRPVDGIP